MLKKTLYIISLFYTKKRIRDIRKLCKEANFKKRVKVTRSM